MAEKHRRRDVRLSRRSEENGRATAEQVEEEDTFKVTIQERASEWHMSCQVSDTCHAYFNCCIIHCWKICTVEIHFVCWKLVHISNQSHSADQNGLSSFRLFNSDVIYCTIVLTQWLIVSRRFRISTPSPPNHYVKMFDSSSTSRVEVGNMCLS